MYIMWNIFKAAVSLTSWSGTEVWPGDFSVSPVCHTAGVGWPVIGHYCDSGHRAVTPMPAAESHTVRCERHVVQEWWSPADLQMSPPEVTDHADKQSPTKPFPRQVDRRSQRGQDITVCSSSSRGRKYYIQLLNRIKLHHRGPWMIFKKKLFEYVLIPIILTCNN